MLVEYYCPWNSRLVYPNVTLLPRVTLKLQIHLSHMFIIWAIELVKGFEDNANVKYHLTKFKSQLIILEVTL